MKTKILFILLVLNACLCKGQTVDLFEKPMLTEKLSQCDLISQYFNTIQHYEYYLIEPKYYGITAEANFSGFSGNYNFAVRNDSLCQFYFMSFVPRKSSSLKAISAKIDSIILAWTKKYGPPDQLIDNRKDSANPQTIDAYTLLNASWMIKEDRLTLRLSYSDAPNDVRGNFGIHIHRFRECYFDKKSLSDWKEF